MNLEDYREQFKKQLSSLYPKEEVDVISSIALEFVLEMNRVEVALSRKQTLSQEHQIVLDQICVRLLNAEPIQYITGTTEFYGLKLLVNPATLIPRPETEELVEWILASLQAKDVLQLLDIGTGSGCIPIVLAKHLPKSNIDAVDISLQAIETAQSNAHNNDVAVTFFQQDILTAKMLPKQYDVIVSNPPYVRELEKEEIKGNVLEHEPHSALFVPDDDPLLFYRKIAQLAVDNLTPQGQLFLEINEYLGKETVALVKEIGFKTVELKKDLFGKDRMVRAYN